MFFRPKRTSNGPLTVAPSLGEMKYRTASLGAAVPCAPAAFGSSSSGADSKLLRVIPITLPLLTNGLGCAREWASKFRASRDAVCLPDEAAQSFFRDPDGDLLGYDRWTEWVMLGVAQHQLKRMFPGWQISERLGFAFAEMNMPLSERDRRVGIGGSTQPMLTRSDNTHIAQTKAAQECAFDDRAISRRE